MSAADGIEAEHPDEREKAAAVFAHLGAALSGFVIPLAIYLAHRDNRASFARHHAVEALNFFFTYALVTGPVAIVSMVFIMRSIEDTGPKYLLIFWFVALVLNLAVWSLLIAASLKATRLERWEYPLTFRFFRH